MRNLSKCILLFLILWFSKLNLYSQEVIPSANTEVRICFERVSQCLKSCNHKYPSSDTRFPDTKRNDCREECITASENIVCRNLFQSSYK